MTENDSFHKIAKFVQTFGVLLVLLDGPRETEALKRDLVNVREKEVVIKDEV